VRLLNIFCTIILWATPHASWGNDSNDYLSLGLRVGALIAQGRLASPPLPTLGKDDRHHLNPQVGYLTGNILGNFSGGPVTQETAGYWGSPHGVSLGLTYTSPSNGSFSWFAYGIHSQATANFQVNISGNSDADVEIRNSNATTSAGGLGVNFILLGNSTSFFAMGLFSGAFYSSTKTRYNFVYLTEIIPGSLNNIPISSNSVEYGPQAGLQAKFRFGTVTSLTTFAMYAADLSDRCMKFTLLDTPYSCFDEIDSSFTSIGASIGLWNFGLSIYSKIWSKIRGADIQLKRFQATYSFKF